MRNQTWPAAARIADWSLAITAHSRGDTGAGGHYEFERAPGASWAGSFTVPPMSTANALAFRAFLHSLRGRSGTFSIAVPDRATATTARTTATSAAAGATSLTLVDASGLQRGDNLLLAGQLFRIGAVSGGAVTVRPRLRAAIAGGTAGTSGPVVAAFRLAGDPPAVQLINGRSAAVQVEIEEAY